MGQLSDPYNQGEDDGIDLQISGLPEEPEEPEGVMDSGPTEPDGDFDDDNDVVKDAEEPEDAASDADADADADVDAEDDEDDDEDDEDDDEDDDDLDPDDESEEIAYELEGWENDQLDALFDGLDEAGIAYLWDGEELFVNETDEQAVDEILEKVANPHQLAADDEGDGGGWLLGELFVVSDRLLHDPEEHESVARLLQLATTADEAEPPYGLGEPEWDALREKVTALATVLEAAEPDADEALEAARELRSAVRPYV